MMCARLLKVKHTRTHLQLDREGLSVGDFHLCVGARVVLEHPASMLLVMLLTIGANVYLYVKIPKGFFPQQDTGRMQGSIVGPAAHLLPGARGKSALV